MQTERYITQMTNAARRYESHLDIRKDRQTELKKIHEGRLSEVNLSRYDSVDRITRRIHSITQDPTASEAIITSAINLSVRPEGEQPTVSVLERIINQDDLMSADFLTAGAKTSNAVGRVVIRSGSGQVLGHGTCFLVSPRLAMTNNHVLDSFNTALTSTVQFDFVETLTGNQLTPIEFTFTPQEFFQTDESLDFTLVAVEEDNAQGELLSKRGWTPLIVESGKAVVGERVNILQHPGGRRQQLALRQNEIIDVPGDFLHYTTDTDRGSSGSPVLNDQWQIAALHHAGVPERDSEQRILLVSGDPWDGTQATLSQISWVANEGVRISRIVAELQSREGRMTDDERVLLDNAFSAPPREETSDTGAGIEQASICPKTGRISWTIPIEFSLQVPLFSQAETRRAPTRRPLLSGFSALDEFSAQNLARARQAFAAHQDDAYYDETADGNAIDEYYTDIADAAVDDELYDALHALLRRTHTTELSYNAARYDHLYPWVDLQEDPRTLLSVYSGKPVDFEDIIQEEVRIEARHEAQMLEFFSRETIATESAVADFRFALENQDPFNCEHVVPQSWFNKKQPMKADLHHLFTCEPGCNSFRGNEPYFQFPLEEEAVRSDCGRVEKNENKFEPDHGKGFVARATLYFLLRYPDLIGDEDAEMMRDRLQVLRDWHRQNPVTDYERHRNAEIAKIQGNRNTLIDFPLWEEAIPFENGFGGR